MIHSVFHSNGRSKSNFSTKVPELSANIDFHWSGRVSATFFFWGERAGVEVVFLNKPPIFLLSWAKCIIKWVYLHSTLKEGMGQIHFLNIIQCIRAPFLGTDALWEFSSFPSGYFYHLSSSILFGSFIKQHLAILYGYWISLICHHKSITAKP